MPKIDRRAIYDRYNGLCGFCGEPVPWEIAHIDHIEPRGLGGKTVMDNLRPAHRRCNIAAGSLVAQERRARGLPSIDGAVMLRKVPEDLWRQVRITAATRGVTIREFLLTAIRAELERETPDAADARLKAAADRAMPKE